MGIRAMLPETARQCHDGEHGRCRYEASSRPPLAPLSSALPLMYTTTNTTTNPRRHYHTVKQLHLQQPAASTFPLLGLFLGLFTPISSKGTLQAVAQLFPSPASLPEELFLEVWYQTSPFGGQKMAHSPHAFPGPILHRSQNV